MGHYGKVKLNLTYFDNRNLNAISVSNYSMGVQKLERDYN